jgi:hypothetical protein
LYFGPGKISQNLAGGRFICSGSRTAPIQVNAPRLGISDSYCEGVTLSRGAFPVSLIEILN